MPGCWEKFVWWWWWVAQQNWVTPSPFNFELLTLDLDLDLDCDNTFRVWLLCVLIKKLIMEPGWLKKYMLQHVLGIQINFKNKARRQGLNNPDWFHMTNSNQLQRPTETNSSQWAINRLRTFIFLQLIDHHFWDTLQADASYLLWFLAFACKVWFCCEDCWDVSGKLWLDLINIISCRDLLSIVTSACDHTPVNHAQLNSALPVVWFYSWFTPPFVQRKKHTENASF